MRSIRVAIAWCILSLVGGCHLPTDTEVLEAVGLCQRDPEPEDLEDEYQAPLEEPIVNLPRDLREWNWGGGSCVHASTVMQLRWQNMLDLAAWWRKTYSGGESYEGLTAKLRKARVTYYSTASGDVSVLQRAAAERVGAVIFFYPNHSIMFVHIDGQKAMVLDNNRIDRYIEIPLDEFVMAWRRYGGVAIVPVVGSPAPPLPWLAAE